MPRHRFSEERLQKAHRFLDAASAAATRHDYETVVSRGYYAVLHALMALSIQAEQSKKHNGVLDSVAPAEQWPSLRNARSIRAALSLIQSWREQADYRLDVISEAQGMDALAFAELFVTRAKEVLEDGN